MDVIRGVMHPRSATHRLIFAFVIASAVIVGLLAMHSVAASTDHADVGSTVASVQADAEISAHGTTTSGDHCAGACSAAPSDPAHSMVLMVCALALVVAALALVAPALLTRHASSVLRPTSAPQDLRARFAPPPSLVALSISRT
ncbi:DUF6153 family protein [uncultured Schumannella sp.]|uniref:DUF6153 family protein n=1 Tax=uncultured Schumannella sp. TaxID=1195956 RepID=UPI0025E92DF5|nr:DUF6153 family protein [uncultured Schumannella sp.]